MSISRNTIIGFVLFIVIMAIYITTLLQQSTLENPLNS